MRFPSSGQFLNFTQEPFQLHRFGIKSSQPASRALARSLSMAWQISHDLNSRQGRIRLDLPGRFPAIQDWQAHIHQNQIRISDFAMAIPASPSSATQISYPFR
jgi:hypothetical protein